MGTVRTLIGYVKGPKGDKGDTGATGAQGPAGQDGAPGVSDYATTEAAGLVRVGDDFNINSSNGVLSIKNAFTRASALAKTVSGEAFATSLGKIAKAVDWVVDNAPNFFNKNADIVDGFTSSLTNKALSANAGKALKTQLDSLNDSLITRQESYTPEITWSTGSGLVTDNLRFFYLRIATNVYWICGRFQVTNIGSPSGSLRISYPSVGNTFMSTSVGASGYFVTPVNFENASSIKVSSIANNIEVMRTPGGDSWSASTFKTGYYAIGALCFVA